MLNRLLKYILSLYLCCAAYDAFTQQTEIDSLQNLLKQHGEDTNKVKILNKLSETYRNQDPAEAAKYSKLALSLSEVLEYKRGIAVSNEYLGVVQQNEGNYDNALSYYLKALSLYQETNYKPGISGCLNNIGAIHFYRENYNKALEQWEQSLELERQLGNNKRVAVMFNNIGVIYEKLDDYDKALEYYNKSLKLREEEGHKEGIAQSLQNIAIIYVTRDEYEKAGNYFAKAITISEELGDKRGISKTLGNLGLLYYKWAEYQSKKGIPANTYMAKYQEAEDYNLKSLSIAKEINAKNEIKYAYKHLSEVYEKKSDLNNAYQYYKKYTSIKDSIYTEESSQKIAEMDAKYQVEKSKREKDSLEKDKELQNAELKRQGIIIWSAAGGIVLLALLVVFIYRSNRQKQVINMQLERKNTSILQQKIEIEKINNEITQKNREITDSIRYAQNIQQAMLPADESVNTLLPNSFVLFKPKAIVSGDFYWIRSPSPTLPKGKGEGRSAGAPLPLGKGPGDGLTLFAACDCTGHGVPGAFMSMICTALLDEAVNEKGLSKPADIFSFVRERIISSLKQTSETQKDGMDAVLCAWDKKKNTIEFACANNSIYLIRGWELSETEKDKQAVGLETGELKPFKNHELKLQKNDTLYLFSDGYSDQFGGPEDKRFMRKRFKELLLSIQPKSMEEQKEILNKTIEDWKGDNEQTDDILVIGVRFA